MILLKRLQEIRPPHPQDQSQNAATDKKVKSPLRIFSVMMMICLAQVLSLFTVLLLCRTSSRVQVKSIPQTIAQALYLPTNWPCNHQTDWPTHIPAYIHTSLPTNLFTLYLQTDWPSNNWLICLHACMEFYPTPLTFPKEQCTHSRHCRYRP